MSINLSDLTSPNNQDALAEITSAADFLDPIGKLENLSRSPNKGGHALQTVALNQPKALPLIDGDGYLYCSGVNNNCALIPDESALDVSGDLTLEADVTLPSYQPPVTTRLVSKYHTTGNQRSFMFYVATTGSLGFVLSSTGSYQGGNEKQSSTLQSAGILNGQRVQLKVTWRASDGRTQFFYKIKGGDYTQLGTDQVLNAGSIYNGTASVVLGGDNEGTSSNAQAAIHSAKIYASINDTNKVLDVDFTATNVRHNSTKFRCATNQIVTINQAGNDPSTIIKKSVLRFANQSDDTTAISLKGLLDQTITDGYMFAAFSVLGDGGEQYGRILGLNSTGSFDSSAGGVAFRRNVSTNDWMIRYNENNITTHSDFFDDERGDYLLEAKVLTGSQKSKINNADLVTGSVTGQLSSEEFQIAALTNGAGNRAAIDLEFLALFSADSVPDEATASKIRNYINSRNQIYLRHQTDGFYFFDPQKADFTGNFTDANTLDGYITGSDNGDTDVRSNLTLEQSTLNDQPSTDGYTITFNDAAEHLEFENGASQNLSGWQVVGTSLGTFAYRVQGAVTELNLLGNAGGHRSVGDSYGIILLPASATGADIEEARSLLINRGAADGTTASSYQVAWYLRSEIKEFKSVNMTGVTNVESAWNSSGLISFDTPLPSAAIAKYAFYNCTQLSDFRTTDIKNGTDFTGCWQLCSALTSFPAGAKLGTEANNVDFSSAWRSSGLTSFPLIDTSRVTNMSLAWYDANLESFPLIDSSNVTVLNYAWYNNNLTSFPSINVSSSTTFYGTWLDNNLLTDFPPIFSNWNPTIITNAMFSRSWEGCTSLTADSVGNILQSIDASNQHGTVDGTSTGNPLGDSGIDIDYNVATGSLSAATNAAVTSLKSKGWVIVVNNVTL